MIICTEKLELSYFPKFLEKNQADTFFLKLYDNINWKIEYYRMFGKILPSPRMMAWYGNQGLNYRYSGIDHLTIPWNDELITLKNFIEDKLNHRFNSVLANLYRDGQDSMGWHADNEPELGQKPVIASLSLGENRRFVCRKRQDNRQSFSLKLEHGSLLVMSGQTQHHWQHAIPKTKTNCLPRVNLTFRQII